MQSCYCCVSFQSSCNRVTAARCPKSHFKQPKIALNMSTANSAVSSNQIGAITRYLTRQWDVLQPKQLAYLLAESRSLHQILSASRSQTFTAVKNISLKKFSTIHFGRTGYWVCGTKLSLAINHKFTVVAMSEFVNPTLSYQMQHYSTCIIRKIRKMLCRFRSVWIQQTRPPPACTVFVITPWLSWSSTVNVVFLTECKVVTLTIWVHIPTKTLYFTTLSLAKIFHVYGRWLKYKDGTMLEW